MATPKEGTLAEGSKGGRDSYPPSFFTLLRGSFLSIDRAGGGCKYY